ncbi:MAG: hypothetical protein QM692_22425 [Thermomicrobiales bacterium]
MTLSARAGRRRAMADIISRRSLVGAATFGAGALFAATVDSDAKKKGKRHKKKRCKGSAQRCGKRCCTSPSICSAGTCFCTANEGACVSISQELIDIIAEGLGVPADQIGANPDQPLPQCAVATEQQKGAIDATINKDFGISGLTPWCNGVTAGVQDIVSKLIDKA